jgi:hypothetical protein
MESSALARDVLSLGGRQRGNGGPLFGASFVERGVGCHHGCAPLLDRHGRRDPLGAGVLDLVLRHEPLRQQLLDARQVVLGVP